MKYPLPQLFRLHVVILSIRNLIQPQGDFPVELLIMSHHLCSHCRFAPDVVGHGSVANVTWRCIIVGIDRGRAVALVRSVHCGNWLVGGGAGRLRRDGIVGRQKQGKAESFAYHVSIGSI